MKINKIVCDICEKEIDVETDKALAMFEHIQVQQKINLMGKERANINSNEEIVKSSFDLCKDCAHETENFLVRQKIANQKANEKGRVI